MYPLSSNLRKDDQSEPETLPLKPQTLEPTITYPADSGMLIMILCPHTTQAG